MPERSAVIFHHIQPERVLLSQNLEQLHCLLVLGQFKVALATQRQGPTWLGMVLWYTFEKPNCLSRVVPSEYIYIFFYRVFQCKIYLCMSRLVMQGIHNYTILNEHFFENWMSQGYLEASSRTRPRLRRRDMRPTALDFCILMASVERFASAGFVVGFSGLVSLSSN